VSRQKQLSVVFVVANVQKQEVIGAGLAPASSTTMFQTLEPRTRRVLGGWTSRCGSVTLGGLTVHRTVIQYPRAASLPYPLKKEKPVLSTGFLERIMSLVNKTLEKRF
jgi:hypothetical protein